MAREAPIGADRNWFIGEDKFLDFGPVEGVADVAGWTAEWTLFDRDGKVVVIDAIAATTPMPTTGGILRVFVPSAATADLAPGSFKHVLRRTNAGSEGVLAFGTVVLRDPARSA